MRVCSAALAGALLGYPIGLLLFLSLSRLPAITLHNAIGTVAGAMFVAGPVGALFGALLGFYLGIRDADPPMREATAYPSALRAGSYLTDARRSLLHYALISLFVGMVPFSPLLTAIVVMGVQLKLLQALCRFYEIDFWEELGPRILGSGLSSFGGVILGMGLGGVIVRIGHFSVLDIIDYMEKFLDGFRVFKYGLDGKIAVGWALISFSAAVFTYGTGWVFVKHFERVRPANSNPPHP